MSYSYEFQKRELFTDDGQRIFIAVRDQVHEDDPNDDSRGTQRLRTVLARGERLRRTWSHEDEPER